jgi:tetratricopeptide (TPR) repeat protein
MNLGRRCVALWTLVVLITTPAESSAQSRPPSARAARLIQLADAYVASGDRGSAIAYYRDAINADPTAMRAYHGLGEVYRARGTLDEARRVFETGLARAPDDAALWLGLTHTLIALGALDDAARALRSLLERHPAQPAALALRADLARERGAWSEALTAYRALLARGELDEAASAQARRYEEALRILAQPLDPVSAERACAGSAVRRALARCAAPRHRGADRTANDE